MKKAVMWCIQQEGAGIANLVVHCQFLVSMLLLKQNKKVRLT